jgi:arginine decarboxylase
VISKDILDFMLALDVKEIHGYRPALGLSVFSEEALREVKNAESVSEITEIVEVEHQHEAAPKPAAKKPTAKTAVTGQAAKRKTSSTATAKKKTKVTAKPKPPSR